MSSSVKKNTVNGTIQMLPSNYVEMGGNSHISKTENNLQSKPRRNISKINPKDWVNNNFHFRSKHSRLFLSAILLCMILAPLSTYNSSPDSLVTVNYLSSSQFELGGDNIMMWEIDGLSARNSNFELFMNDERVEYGTFSKEKSDYNHSIEDLPIGNYIFTLKIKDSSHIIQSYASVSISNKAPVLDCKTESTTFELGSPESLDFEILDKSVNNSFYEITLSDENSSFTESELWDLDSTFSYPISHLSVGNYDLDLVFFDDLGYNSSISKSFNIVENLAPILSGTDKRAVVEKGEIYNSIWGIKDYNCPLGIYTISLDNKNVSSGIWERDEVLNYDVQTENLTVGDHRIKLLIVDELGDSSELGAQFTIVTSRPPVIISPETEYEYSEGLVVEFDVSDFEFLSNASYVFANSLWIMESGLLSDLGFSQINSADEPQNEKLNDNNFHLEFNIEEKWINTESNYFKLIIEDGKGGSSTFTINVHPAALPPSSVNEIDYNFLTHLIQLLPLIAIGAFVIIKFIISILFHYRTKIKSHKKQKIKSIPKDNLINKFRAHPGRMIKVFSVLILNLGIVSALTGASAVGGDNPIYDLSLSTGYTEEPGITGWVNGSEFRIRIFDELQLSWTSTNVTCNNVIKIKNATSGEEIMQESLYLAPGFHTHSILLDPNRSLRADKNFLPDQNYTVQIWLQDFQMLQPVVLGYSDEIEFSIIKAKAQFEFFSPDGYAGSETGMYIVDYTTDPINPHYQYYYQAQLVDAFNISRVLRNKEIRLFIWNASKQPEAGYDFVIKTPSDSNGKFFYDEERFSIQGIPLVWFDSLSDSLYETTNITEILSSEFIYSPFDYNGPSTIETVTETGVEPVEPTMVNTLTQIQRIWEWNTVGDYQGFLLNNTSGFYSYGVSPELLSLYLGTITGNNLTAEIISPGTYYFGEDISTASITSTFKTIHDINSYTDNYYDGDIFDVDLILYDEDFNILEEFDLFAGGIVDFTTKTLNLSKTSFSRPTIFRMGFRFNIKTNADWDYPDWDYMDEFYFCLQKVDFDIQFKNPQWGSGSMNDWSGYSWGSRTKAMECTFDTSSFTLATRSGDSTSSSFSDIFSVGEVVIDSPINFTHVDLSSSTISLDMEAEIRQVVYQSQDNDGDYSIYVIPILNDGTRLNQIFANSGSITTTILNSSISLDATSLIGQDIEKFAIRVWMSVPIVGYGTPDLYNIFFESAEVTVDSTEIFDMVDVSDPSSPPSYYVYRTLEQLPNPITLYNPESEGFIVDKLVAGEFAQGTTTWDDFPTITGNHVNASYFYSDGDYVIAEDNPIYGSDESEQWSYLHTGANYINFESIFSAEDYCAGYTFAYIYFPRLEDSVFLKLGSNEGSRIWLDGEEICYNHVIRSLATQNSEEEHDIVDLGPISAGWHRVMTMTENKDKKYVMRYRISTTGGEGDANYTPISGLKVAVNKYQYDPRFHPVYLDTVPEKTSKTDPNRDSLLLTVPEQRVEANSYAEIISVSPFTDASGLSGTLFNGTLYLDVLGFVESWQSTSVPLFGELYFDLYVQQGPDLVREYSELVYSSELSDATMFNLQTQEIQIDLDSAFVNYTGSENPDLSDYQVRFISKFTTDQSGWAPEAGFEIIKSSLVLTDLPPSGDFYNIQSGSILSGMTPLQVSGNTHDIVGVRYLGSSDGISWATIGEVGTHTNWIFTYNFDTVNSAIFPANDDEFYIQAQLRDDFKVVNTSFITVCIDNIPAFIDFAEDLSDNMTISMIRNISVFTNYDDVDHISFEAKLFNDTWDPANIISLSQDTYIIDHGAQWEYGFTFDPWTIPVGTYNFRAVSYDKTLNDDLIDMDEIINVLLMRFDPEFHNPSPENFTGMVKDTFFFNLSSNALSFDNISIYTANSPTTILSETTFTEFTTLNYNASDIYYFGLNTTEAFGMVEDMYYIRFDFRIDSYIESYYYLLYVDNVAPTASLSIPDVIFEDFYDPYVEDTFPRINSSMVQLDISPYDNCDDLVSLEYFVEIYSKNNSQYLRIPLRQFSIFNVDYFTQSFDVSSLPDGEIIFGITIVDCVGHTTTTKTQKYFLDKRSPEIFLYYPSINQQILVDPNTENILNFTVNYGDNDIKNISLYGEILGNEYIVDDLNFTDFAEFPDGVFNFSIYIDQPKSYDFFRKYIENPTLEWKITSFDYFGQKTVQSQQFTCVEILDIDAPIINRIEIPSLFSEWTGGFGIVLDTKDFDSNMFIYSDDWLDNSGIGCSVEDNVTFLAEHYNLEI